MVTVGCLPMLHSNGKFGSSRAVSSLLVVGVMLGGEAMKVARAYVGVKKARPTSGIPISFNTVFDLLCIPCVHERWADRDK